MSRITETPISLSSRRRVDNATRSDARLSLKRCLIENTEEVNTVQYAHCLSRKTENDLLLQLEYAWGLPRHTLNLDTRYNIICLSEKMRRLFDKNTGWMLLPEETILRQYYVSGEVLIHDNFPNLPNGPYNYTLIAHTEMKKVPIHRQNTALGVDEDGNPVIPSKADYVLHRYPYTDFPTIVSHLHPRFVIANTALKLEASWKIGKQFEWDPDILHALRFIMIINIWGGWTQDLKDTIGYQKFMHDKPPSNDKDKENDDCQSTSVMTRTGRVFAPSAKRVHDFPTRDGSPTPSGRRRMFEDEAESEPVNDDDALHESLPYTPDDFEEPEAKDKRIMRWLDTVGSKTDDSVHSKVIKNPDTRHSDSLPREN